MKVMLMSGVGVNVDAIIWSVIEVYAAMICACLMTLRPLLAKTMPRLFSNTNRSESGDPSSNNSWIARVGLHGVRSDGVLGMEGWIWRVGKTFVGMGTRLGKRVEGFRCGLRRGRMILILMRSGFDGIGLKGTEALTENVCGQ